jgi:hypothetical protein
MKLKAFISILLILVSSCATSHADAPVTYTVEPFDMDGTFGISMSITQLQFNGKYCPCVKIPYPADGFHNQQGADAINSVAKKLMKPGDRLMGFSLGVQVISLDLAKNTLPKGVEVLLAGDTFARNQQLINIGQGIPWDIANPVTMVVNEYDGWSDMPTLFNSGWGNAFTNAVMGTQRFHYYAKANPDDTSNVVVKHGNITSILIPTVNIPLGESQRDLINTAYDRPGSNPSQQKAASSQQVPWPNPAWHSKPEPAAAVS